MKYYKGNFEVEAARFEPTVPIPAWVMKFVKPWSEAGYQPHDGSWGYILQNDDRLHVVPGDWVVKYPNDYIVLYKDSEFQSLYKPLQEGDAANEASLLDIIQDLQSRVAMLEAENQSSHFAHYKLTSQDYEDIYKEVMKRSARDLRLNRGVIR